MNEAPEEVLRFHIKFPPDREPDTQTLQRMARRFARSRGVPACVVPVIRGFERVADENGVPTDRVAVDVSF